MDFDGLVRLLREMDHQQTVTDAAGERELAWYYWRPEIEQALGLTDGALDTGGPEEWRACDNSSHGHEWQ